MKTISIINYKGGVGKTTLTANLGARLAQLGKRVLMIDLDPQASLTFSFISQDKWAEYQKSRTIKSWYDAFIENDIQSGIIDLIVKPAAVTAHLPRNAKLDLICSHIKLINVDLDLATRLVGSIRDVHSNFLKVHTRLRQGLVDLQSNYDVVLIDCPPSFNIVTKTAIVASDFILVPTKADYLSTIGFEGLHENIEALRSEFNEYANESSNKIFPMNPQWLGIIFTMVSLRLGEPIRAQKGFVSSIIDSSVERLGKDVVFDCYLRENKTLHADAPLAGVPVVLESVRGSTYEDVKRELIDFADVVSRRIGL